MNYNGEIFKKRLKSRFEEGTSQSAISYEVGMLETKLSKCFNNSQKPNIDELLYISNKYNCSIDWLLGNDSSTYTKDLSIYQFCKTFVDLDSSVGLTFTNVDALDINGKHTTLPCIYYKRYKELLDNQINGFFRDYVRIRDLYMQGIIKEKDFNAIVNSNLKDLPKESVINSGMDLAMLQNSLADYEGYDIPFNESDSSAGSDSPKKVQNSPKNDDIR